MSPSVSSTAALNTTHGGQHVELDEGIARLQQRARDALVQDWNQWRFDYWVTLEWHRAVSEMTANEHLERLLRDLHRTVSPAIHVVTGFHPYPHAHAHAAVHLSRRVRARFLNAAEFEQWLRAFWYHGQVWAQVFDPTRRESGSGGAIEYLARNPGTVVWG